MLIFHETQKLSDFSQNPKSILARLKSSKSKIATYLTANGKDAAVVVLPKLFAKIESELLKLSIDNIIYESDLEEFRIGKLSSEDLRKRLRPNPGALGIPAEEAFAKLRQKINRRKRQKIKNRK